MYQNEWFEGMKPEYARPLSQMPSELTPEEQIQWLENENRMLREDFNRLCDIVADIQYTITRMMQYSETRVNDLEWALQRHTNRFHSMLIIGTEKKEGGSNESDIS